MITIEAKLCKDPVYFSGEVIECHITFCNPPTPIHQKSQSHSDVFECLAWASAQLHCQCTTHGGLVQNDKFPFIQNLTAINADTTFAPWQQDKGYAVITMAPKILFCDLKLSLGESKTYVYRETIPSDAPPSYKGLAVQYSYKITIGTQRVNSGIERLRVPIRVLSLSELPETATCNDSVDLSPNNPFMETQDRDTPLDMALQTLQNLTARRSPNFYNITNGRGCVTRFCLFKNSYKLGEDIVGTFDFSNATVTCSQVSVSLQSEEHVSKEYARDKNQKPTLRTWEKKYAVCLGLQSLQLVLPIPFTVTPDFTTDLVTLKWRLRFDFVTAPKKIEMPNENTISWRAPNNVGVEATSWDLPLHVHPAITLPTPGMKRVFSTVIWSTHDFPTS